MHDITGNAQQYAGSIGVIVQAITEISCACATLQKCRNNSVLVSSVLVGDEH